MISILVTATLSLMLGSLIGMFLVVLCQAGSERDSILYPMQLIPIEAGEPRLNSQCLIQTKEDGNHLMLADYAEDGWTLIDYPGIRTFTVAAWCYQPDPIREVDA